MTLAPAKGLLEALTGMLEILRGESFSEDALRLLIRGMGFEGHLDPSQLETATDWLDLDSLTETVETATVEALYEAIEWARNIPGLRRILTVHPETPDWADGLADLAAVDDLELALAAPALVSLSDLLPPSAMVQAAGLLGLLGSELSDATLTYLAEASQNDGDPLEDETVFAELREFAQRHPDVVEQLEELFDSPTSEQGPDLVK
jgi:hypothetical protein